MALHLLMFLHIILLLWPMKASLDYQCPATCGNLNIWYPFGIGEHCYYDKWFEVTCDNFSGAPRAFLKAINLEISYSLFSNGLYYYSSQRAVVKIEGNILNEKEKIVENLSGSPFSLSNTYNLLVAFDCCLYANGSLNTTTPGECQRFLNGNPTRNSTYYDFLCRLSSNLTLDGGIILNKYPQLQQCSNPPFMADQQLFQSNYLTNRNELKKEREITSLSLEWGKRRGRCSELFNPSYTSCNKDNYCIIQLKSRDYYCLCDDQRSDDYKGCAGDLICNTTGNNNCSKCPYGYVSQNNYDETLCSYSRSYNEVLKKHSLVKFYIITGCSAGFGMVLLLIGAWWLYKFMKRRKAIKLKQKFFERNGGLLLKENLSSNKGGSIDKTKLFTSEELEKATDNYNANRIIGQGGQGTVYKGMLEGGRIVAIKKSKKEDKKKVEEFINEVVILSQINHRNVVKLLGCCLETEVPLLVYEFIPNGTLFQHLHEENEEFPITWEMLLRIAIEVAKALYHLHSGASLPIYHRDIKSTNILLDEKYRAKVSDFGTSRSVTVDQTHLTTHVQGTFGYLDPEYFQSSQFTEKSDVHSFGVVLAELLTGEKSIRPTNIEEDRSLVAYFLSAMEENRLFEVLDARVLKEGGKQEIVKVANLTRRCLNPNRKKRPTMKEVAIELAGNIRASSSKALVVLQNHKEIDCLDGKISGDFTASSSFSTRSVF